MIRITNRVAIPLQELEFVTSRSSGPGGQHANKASTRVTLLFDLEGSPSLGHHERELIRSRLGTRISKEGLLRVTSQRHRSQALNREAALQRFAELLSEALSEEDPRLPTKTPPGLKQERLAEKRRRGRLKKLRGGDGSSEEDW